MDHIDRVLESHPNHMLLDKEALTESIRACYESSQSCFTCADILLERSEGDAFNKCIRLCLSCAEDCATTGRLLLQLSSPDWDILRKQLDACIAACRACGDSCDHLKNKEEICLICIESCRQCERTCQGLIDIMPIAKKLVKVSVP